ncbi:MAG: hypothetical protein JNL36_09465 [Candidatus Kapabacteria bacterium]|nr:hypothetical protein [Candidatus Kapabacteria bacterium]
MKKTIREKFCKYKLRLVSIFKFILLFVVSTSLSTAQTRNIEELGELDVMALHQLALQDETTPLQLFLHCTKLGIIDHLLTQGSVLSENVKPEYVLFFDGSTQKNISSIINTTTQKEVQQLTQGNLLAVIVFEDSPNERYNLQLTSKSSGKNGTSWVQLTNVTQVHTNGSPAFTYLIHPKTSTTTLPNYYARIEFFRYNDPPVDIEYTVVEVPGYSPHFNNFGVGVSYVWTRQPVTSFEFNSQTLATTATREPRNEFRGDGMISLQVFPDNDPRQPSRFPWERRFYHDLLSRFGFQASMGFTRFPTYFDHWFVGGTFKLYHKLYLYSGVSFVQLPIVNTPTILTGNQLINPDQYMRGEYEQLFFMGLSVPIFEF